VFDEIRRTVEARRIVSARRPPPLLLSLVGTVMDTVQSDQLHPDPVMDAVESDAADAPIVVQIGRVALVAALITIAVWLVTNYALDLLGVSFSK
jgi:hypothetical protein